MQKENHHVNRYSSIKNVSGDRENKRGEFMEVAMGGVGKSECLFEGGVARARSTHVYRRHVCECALGVQGVEERVSGWGNRVGVFLT